MPRQIHEFDPPERFVAGTVGEPGERTFFLQARADRRIVSVALEKAQVAVLAERLTALLDEVRRLGADAVPPDDDDADVDDLAPLDAPLTEEFRVGTLALAWDGNHEQVVVEAHSSEADSDDEAEIEPLVDTPDGPDTLRVRIRPDQARSFVRRALAVVAAGRPPCPFCDRPLDPAGHVCPRMNGFRG